MITASGRERPTASDDRLPRPAAEGREHLVADLPVAQLRVVAGRARRPARPHVVVADDAPAPDAVLAVQPLHGGQELPRGHLAGEEHARRALAALVERGVDVGDEIRHPRGHGLAHGGDVPADDGVDQAGRGERAHLVGHLGRRPRSVDHGEAQLAAEHTVPRVDLRHRELCAQLARRPEDPCGPMQRDHQSEINDGLVHGTARYSCTMVPPDSRKSADIAVSTEELALLLGEAERRVTRRLAQVLADLDCSVERWRTLALLDGGESHRMSELAEVAQLPPASLTRLIDGMVGDNLVYRKADARDRRLVLVHVTPRGRALYRRLSERIGVENGAIFGEVGQAELAHLVESLADFVARLR